MENRSLLELLVEEMKIKLKGGLYHRTQIKLAYNSNRIEGSTLSEEQTRDIFETIPSTSTCRKPSMLMTDTCLCAQDRYRVLVSYFLPERAGKN
ncbi:Fido domain protein [Acididesulfobacillus acetoxydans]|uniref:Fido domain protein n=1 Tax=Acididesulfobacillus acetoxydans TaxID=1561005 RepID=A0A8S0X2Z9_9FIRM|nr:Fido domain protein [Acididesulfobacillus acetoxydans]CEJ06202.1 Hypothetical protein DEACI_0649 [Acididesulfobacillus acetoxydans]